MHNTSDLYRELLEGNHQVETRLAIGEAGTLITKQGEKITFGGVSILVGSSGAEGGYDESILISVETRNSLFSEDLPEPGGCVSGEIDVEMYKPTGEIPRMARIAPYIRLTDGERHSEWIKKGVYYLDSQEKAQDGTTLQKIILHGYDAMLKAEQDYPDSKLTWPAKDVDVVQEVADAMGVGVDGRTLEIMTDGYEMQYPAGYSCREVLSFLAVMYAGSFIMSDEGDLRLVTLYGIPEETSYLITQTGQAVTFGGVRILV